MPRRRDERGITLLELMIAALILSVILMGVYNMFGGQERAYVMQNQMAQMNQNARVALGFISQNIQNAGYDPNDAGAGITRADGGSIVFTQDLDENGSIDSPGECLGFRQIGSRIDQCLGSFPADCDPDTDANWQVLVEQIQRLRFRYDYANGQTSDVIGFPDDGDINPDNDFGDIREIEINVESQGGTAFFKGFHGRVLPSRIVARNIGIKEGS